jgi:hypothetical protein
MHHINSTKKGVVSPSFCTTIVSMNVNIIFYFCTADITCSNLKRASITGVTTAADTPTPCMTGPWAAADDELAAAAAAAALASE